VNVRPWQCTWIVACGVIAAGCSLRARYAETASEPDAPAFTDAGPMMMPAPDASPSVPPIEPDTSTVEQTPPPAPPPPAAPSCPSDLAQRLSVTRIDVNTDIRYRDATTDGFPMDQRVSLGVARDGRAYVAWTDLAGGVRVTPLDSDLKRAGEDIVVDGQDLGGFVVRDDGFALLTRRADPGDPLTDWNTGMSPVKATWLVRYRGRTQVFAVPLTGTKSITSVSDSRAKDCAPYYLYGRLAWNGARYGAYFQVYGCTGDPHQGASSDKLVYVDDEGRPSNGGWGWNCSNNLGIRMLPEPGAFTTVCLADSSPAPGLNLVTEGAPARQLSPEFTQASYAAAVFGSIMKVPADGSYVLGWLSRGVTTAQGRAAPVKQAYDIAFMRLGADYVPLGPKQWLFETSDVAEINLHMSPYGRDRTLVTWERIENPRCTDRMCWGPYSGTRARLIDLEGNPLSADAVLTTPPNTGDDIAVFPNLDLGWAFVADDQRSYENPVNPQQRPASKRQLSVARMRVCE
jgi:hypothetical protein